MLKRQKTTLKKNMCSYTVEKELGACRGQGELRVWRSGDPITEARRIKSHVDRACSAGVPEFNDIHTKLVVTLVKKEVDTIDV
jgi:hypothetical protein